MADKITLNDSYHPTRTEKLFPVIFIQTKSTITSFVPESISMNKLRDVRSFNQLHEVDVSKMKASNISKNEAEPIKS